MQRRDFSKLVGALPAFFSSRGPSVQAHQDRHDYRAGGARLNYYFESLALAKTSAPFHLTAIAFAPGALAPALT